MTVTRLLPRLAALAVAASLHGQPPPEVQVSLDRSDVAIGDQVTATYSARLPKGARLEVEALVTPSREEGASSGPEGAGGNPAGVAPSLPVLEFLPLGPETLGADGAWSRGVGFAPFAAGELVIPGPHLVYVSPSGERVAVRAPSASLRVSSRLPQDKKPDELSPKPDRAVRIPERSAWFWASIAAGALLLAALVWWLLRRRRKAEAPPVPAAPPVAPGVELILALSELDRRAAVLDDDPRGFYSDLTHVVKRYLERRLELPVLEWTTFETVRRLRERDLEMPREIGLNELLSNADRVKFGKGRSTRDEARLQVSRARMLHDHLEERLRPKVEPPAEKQRAS